jgi:signal transduction histidine kinase
MNSSVASHVFDPFFTTKPSGTGLGLSICHELVQAHGGDIRVDSEEGHGTSVRITIPAAHA